AINPSSNAHYLLLNALVPVFISFAALIPILRQPDLNPHPSGHDRFIFIILNLLAVITGIYLLITPSFPNRAKLFLSGAIILLILPLAIPELAAEAILVVPDNNNNNVEKGVKGCFEMVIEGDKLGMLEEEHGAKRLLCRIDFWLYYLAYFCGGTIGLVYSNNLGQIAQSLGLESSTSTLITLYSAFSFFGRLLSAAPEFLRTKLYLARTGWLAVAIVPTTVAFLVLSLIDTEVALQIGTSLIGLSSGFIFAAAVSITSDLFGPNNVGVNHNILITNIPLGSIIYGFASALVYDSNAGKSTVCMGRNCYFATFIMWGGVSVLGLVSTVLLFVRTRHAYNRFEHRRVSLE
ncbi:hypothetical protein M8C21_027095, partial [Ambrosia artemisiifolia]